MATPDAADAALLALMRAIAGGDAAAAGAMLAATPDLARASLQEGASRNGPPDWFLPEVGRTLYAGDTAIHVAAAAYQTAILGRLLALGGDARARNRRGAEPLHSAASGAPGSSWWNPEAQAATIRRLLAAGADPNAPNANGATPLHIAARTRSAAAVEALLTGGADPQRRNKGGSTAAMLAAANTGRGGTGSAAAKAEQAAILRLLRRAER